MYTTEALLSRTRSFAQLTTYRSHYFLYPWVTFVGLMIGSKGQPPLFSMFLVLLISYLASVSVYLLGDAVDIDIDKLNVPDRPLPSGSASQKDALLIVTFSGLTSLILAFLLNFEILAITMISLLVGYLYSLPFTRLKKRFLVKTAITASGGMLATFAGGAGMARLDMQVISAGISYFIYMAGVTTITDLRDMEGDRIHGIKTLPVVLGPSWTVKIALLEISFVGTFPLLFYCHTGFTVLFPMFALPVLISSVLSLYPLIYKWGKRDLCIKVKRRLVFLFIVYQIGLMAGAAPLNLLTIISSVTFTITLMLLKVLRREGAK